VIEGCPEASPLIVVDDDRDIRAMLSEFLIVEIANTVTDSVPIIIMIATT
jgi:hypothetical protein